MKARTKVEEHTERGGTASHVERDPEFGRVEISYRLYDCAYCDEEGISSMANFDTWEEVWMSVREHLSLNHSEKLQSGK